LLLPILPCQAVDWCQDTPGSVSSCPSYVVFKEHALCGQGLCTLPFKRLCSLRGCGLSPDVPGKVVVCGLPYELKPTIQTSCADRYPIGSYRSRT
jgi:hypothetical protein